jgi:hypothetical protein
MESGELLARAERAYEIGRLRWARQIGWIVLALVGVSFVCVGVSAISAATGALLLATTTAMRWRGQTLSAAVRSGLLAGLIPFTLLLVLKSGSGVFCALGGCMEHCIRYCGIGGLTAGLLLAVRARSHEDHLVGFLVASGVVAALTGILGCFVGGLTGMVWMIAGELLATVPVFAVQRARR